MWSDVVLRAEQLHLLQLLFWGALSVVSGTGTLLFAAVKLRGTSLLRPFALQTTIWGALELLLAGVAYRSLALRDIAGTARLERTAWLFLGLYLGIVAVGVTLAIAAWRFAGRDPSPHGGHTSAIQTGFTPRALSTIGAGIGVALQGLALAVLQLLFVAHVSR